MDNSSLFLGIGLTMLILVPSYYLATAGKRRLKKELNIFFESLKKQSININDYDQLGEYTIGIDNTSGTLVYKKGDNSPEIVNIKNILSCGNNIPDDSKRKNPNCKLFLEVMTKDRQNPKITLEFYEPTFGLNPSKEIKLIQTWTTKINDYIRNS